MLKLELVRFSFSPLDTYGVMHSRDGWSCFTRESVVLNTVTPPPGKAALGEGLYRVRATERKPKLWVLELFDVDDAPAVSQIFCIASGQYQPGDIIIGYSVDTVAGYVTLGTAASHDLLHMVRKHDETYINIRHLDNTQLLHFQRTARELVQ